VVLVFKDLLFAAASLFDRMIRLSDLLMYSMILSLFILHIIPLCLDVL
jgi:hypothetical protein